MGNPKRYMIDGYIIRPPKVEGGWLSFSVHEDQKECIKLECPELTIDFYSAPDVILTYDNGNSCKDEWGRYSRHIFTDATLIGLQYFLEYYDVVYSFNKMEGKTFNWLECYVGVPIGKLANMTMEEVEEYYRVNKITFKSLPKPTFKMDVPS